MKSGMLAAEATYTAIAALPEDVEMADLPSPVDISSYQTDFDNSWVAKELKEVRNLRPSFHNPLGNLGGIIYSGIDSILLKGRVPWTFHHPKEDYASTKPASCVPFLRGVSLTNPLFRTQRIQADRLPLPRRRPLLRPPHRSHPLGH